MVGNKNRELRDHTSRHRAYCEIPYEKGWAKGTDCNSLSLGFKFHLLEKGNPIAGSLGNLLTPHDLCDENHEQRVEARVQALLRSIE
jgi:hypothetical protein